MAALHTVLPDVSVLLTLTPEDLAQIVLPILKENLQHGKFHPANLLNGQVDLYVTHRPSSPRPEMQIALAEALHWLFLHSLTMPAPGDSHGWHVITRRGMALKNDDDFRAFRQASIFPKSLLHPLIADQAWLSIARGDYEVAVFAAFKTVEIRVREAGDFDDKGIGTELMRKAFSPTNGPLTDSAQPVAEREALSALFAGAVGSYKNPHSHRTVTISDASEAQEMVMLASHLLRIVDDREAKRRSPPC